MLAENKELLRLINISAFKDAVVFYESLRKSNKSSEFTFLGGVSYLNSGNPKKAIDLFSELAREKYNVAACHYNLALCYKMIADHKKVVISCDVALSNEHSNKLNLLRMALTSSIILKDKNYFLKMLQKYLVKENEKSMKLYFQASVELGMKNYLEAATLFEDSLKVEPSHVNSLIGLADCQRLQLKYRSAVESYTRAISLGAHLSPELYNNIGSSFLRLRNLESAEEHFLEALNLNQNFAPAANNLGLVYNLKNNREKATQYFMAAVKLDLCNPTYLRNLTLAHDYKTSTSTIEQLVLKPACKNILETTEYQFALGKTLHELRDYKRAYDAFSKGNRLRKDELSYTIEKDKALIEKAKNLYSNSPEVASCSLKSRPRPIFIVGLPRTGSSLAEQILSAHPSITPLGELPIVNSFFSQPAVKNTLTLEDAKSFRKMYFESHWIANTTTEYITDKLPANFKWIGILSKIFPEAKFIMMERSSQALIWSNYTTYFPNDGNGFCYSLQDLVDYLNMYRQLKNFWFKNNIEIFDLNYDNLISQTTKQVKSICEFLNLQFSDTMLEIETNKNIIFTASSNQARQNIYTGSNDVWKNYQPYIRGEVSLVDF